MTEASVQELSDRQLRVRRQRLASAVERPETTLSGSLVRQGRRCSSEGAAAGEASYTARISTWRSTAAGRTGRCTSRRRWRGVVDEYVGVTRRNDTALAEIALINVELLRRRALG